MSVSASTPIVEQKGGDTLPGLFLANYKRYGSKKLAMRKKKLGIWQRHTWQDCYEQVKYFSLGLVSLGLQPGDKVAVLGDNDPEWYWAELAAQAAGGVALGIFTDAIPSEVKYIAEHSDSKFIVARDQEQVDKILQIKTELPLLRKLIYWDPLGLTHYDDPILMNFQAVVQRGREYEPQHPEAFEQNIAKTRPHDVAVLCYTSGTTGLPKGVMITHNNFIASIRSWFQVSPHLATDDYISYMSPAWVPEQSQGITGWLVCGNVVNFPEEPETSQEDTREVGPQVMLYGPRLWESLVSTIQAKILDTSPIKRFLYNMCLPVGYKVAGINSNKQTPGLLWRVLYRLCDWVVFRPLKDKIGLARSRDCFTAGSYLSPDTLKYFRAIGCNLKQLFAATEVAMVTSHLDGDVRSETVGPPLPGVEVKISEEGEILIKSPGVVPGYYKNPEATQKMIKNGWFHTGDAGHIDETGHLIYWDRVTELIELAGGQKFSPQYIEGRLKFSPYIKDVMALGGKEKPYVTVIVIIDYENVGRWAERNHVAYTTYTDLSQKDQVLALIRKDITRVNGTLPAAAKIRRFAHLHKEFDPDEAELTRTRKLRRGFMEERYGDLIKAIYAGRAEYVAEATITYRDGRKGKVATTIKIQTME
ncbi:MAG: AMP-binding protein [Chloroflexi bacterium]|nr:AMP-binding protein [Chloroflexota bacterium]